jgi:hypothetical protein
VCRQEVISYNKFTPDSMSKIEPLAIRLRREYYFEKLDNSQVCVEIESRKRELAIA